MHHDWQLNCRWLRSRLGRCLQPPGACEWWETGVSNGVWCSHTRNNSSPTKSPPSKTTQSFAESKPCLCWLRLHFSGWTPLHRLLFLQTHATGKRCTTRHLQHLQGRKNLATSHEEAQAMQSPDFVGTEWIEYLSTCLSIYLSIHPSMYISIHVSICISVYISIYVSIYKSIYTYIYSMNIHRHSIYIYIYMSTYIHTYLSIHKIT